MALAVIRNLPSFPAFGFMSWRGLSSVWLLVVIWCSLGVLEVEGGNCSLVGPMIIEREGTLYNISGPHISVYPKLNGVVQYDTILGWKLTTFIERDKVNQTLDGGMFPSGQKFYSGPTPDDNPFNPMVDPLEPFVPGQACTHSSLPCGVVLNYMNAADLDCWAERVIAPFHGRTRESVYFYFSNPAAPGFEFIMENHVVDGDVTVPLNNPGYPISEEYSAESLKIAYQWSNIPWVGSPYINLTDAPTNNGSTFEFWVDYDRTFLSSLSLSVHPL